jgi:serpin B
MMYQKSTVMVTDDNELNCKVVELPYKGDNFSMIVILPNEIDGLSSLEQRLTFKDFNRLINKLYKLETEIVLPKFNITSNIDLKTILSNLGVSDIFIPTMADFSHMVRPDDQYGELYVSDAIHEAVVVVSEEGSEATAATHFVILFHARINKSAQK